MEYALFFPVHPKWTWGCGHTDSRKSVVLTPGFRTRLSSSKMDSFERCSMQTFTWTWTVASEEVWGSCENSLACRWKRREPMKDLLESINSAVKMQPYPSFRAISLISRRVYGHFSSLLFFSFRPLGNSRFITRLILIFIDISSCYVAFFFFQIRVLNSKAVCKGCTWWSAGCCLKTAAMWGTSGSFHTWISHWLPYRCAFSLHHRRHQRVEYCATLRHRSLVLHQHMYIPLSPLVAWEHFIVSVSQTMVYWSNKTVLPFGAATTVLSLLPLEWKQAPGWFASV